MSVCYRQKERILYIIDHLHSTKTTNVKLPYALRVRLPAKRTVSVLATPVLPEVSEGVTVTSYPVTKVLLMSALNTMWPADEKQNTHNNTYGMV